MLEDAIPICRRVANYKNDSIGRESARNLIRFLSKWFDAYNYERYNGREENNEK